MCLTASGRVVVVVLVLLLVVDAMHQELGVSRAAAALRLPVAICQATYAARAESPWTMSC